MSSEIIHSVIYDNYDDFRHVNFIFSQNFISLFLFNDETDLRVRYLRTWCPHHALFARDGRNIKLSVVSFGSLYCLFTAG